MVKKVVNVVCDAPQVWAGAAMTLTPRTLVRVSPSACPRGRSRHYGRAIVVSVGHRTACIKPLGRHRKLEEVSLGHLRIWKARPNPKREI